MAKRVTEDDKILMNELYIELKPYAAVARETGFSASTVKKYIVSGYTPQAKIEIKPFAGIVSEELPPLPQTPHDWFNFMKITEEEKQEMEELRKEVLI